MASSKIPSPPSSQFMSLTVSAAGRESHSKLRSCAPYRAGARPLGRDFLPPWRSASFRCSGNGVRATPDLALRLVAGAAAAALIAGFAWRLRALSAGGAAAAVFTGTVAVAAGWSWGIILLCYFAASILISRIGERRKTRLLAGIVAKGGGRDQRQVLANGLVFIIASLGYIAWSSALATICGTATEREYHSCGARTMHHSGARWMDNDMVNLCATTVGAATALVLISLRGLS